MLTSMTDAPEPDRDDDIDPAPHAKRRRLWVGLGAVAAVLVIAAAIAIPLSIANAKAEEEAAAERAAAAAEAARLKAFAGAFQACGTPASQYLEILDGGEALSIAGVGKYYGPSYQNLLCLLGELDAPDTLESKIGATRALDGVQTDEWAGYEIEWRYHPDDGATVLIEHAK